MSISKRTKKVSLEVHTKDEAAEIFIIDGQFQIADRGLGLSKSFSLDPGIYTVKVRAGFETLERDVILHKGQKKPVVEEFGSVQFSSPAPLDNTGKTHEYHIKAAKDESRNVHARVGSGSYIYLFVRDWTPPACAGSGFQVTTAPHKGLTLRDEQDKIIVDFSKQSEVSLKGDPFAACNVEVDPGAYRLSLELSSGGTCQQTIIATEGWQTQIFLLQRDYKSEESKSFDRQADVVNASILLSKPLGFDPASPTMRLVEQARLGLSNTRQVLPDKVVNDILAGKFKNPMLGIYGAYLLMLREKPDTNLLRVVVNNLRNLLGTSQHPDVEALALHLDPNDVSHVFNVPPMLQRSWWRVVDATATRPLLVPQDCLASEVANSICGEGPWLHWFNLPKGKGSSKAQRADELKQLKALLESHLQTSLRQTEAGEGRGKRAGKTLPTQSRARATASRSPSSVGAAQSIKAAESSAPSAKASPTQSAVELGEDVLKNLIQRLGIPRNKLEGMLQNLQQKKKSKPE